MGLGRQRYWAYARRMDVFAWSACTSGFSSRSARFIGHPLSLLGALPARFRRVSDAAGYACGIILLCAECYLRRGFWRSASVINADPLRRKPLPRDEDADLPTVDVFIPTYNEDEYILATTVRRRQSRWRTRSTSSNVYLLDDGGTDQKNATIANPEKAAAARERRASLQILCAQMVRSI